MSKNQFGFNLLPKKSKQEVKIQKDRDDAFLYTLVLIFVAVFIYFALNIIDSLLVQTRIDSIQEAISNTEEQINANRDTKLKHGELIEKSRLIGEVLEKDINVDNLFSISSELVPNREDILSYERLSSGEFSLQVSIQEYEEATALLERANSNSGISESRLTSIIVDPTHPDNLTVRIIFSIIEEA